MENLDSLNLLAREFLQKVTAELDPHTKHKGVITNVDARSTMLLTPSHIQFAIYGRGPGRKPPFEPILEWVKEKNILFKGTTQRGTAFAVQKMIAARGTKHWVKNAPSALEEAIKNNYDEYNEKMGNQLNIIMERNNKYFMDKLLPDIITYKL